MTKHLRSAMRRWVEIVAVAICLALAAAPFVILFPEPPAFGRPAAGIVALVAILATLGAAYQAAPRPTQILRRATILLAVTVAAVASRIQLAGDITAKVPTLDILPAVFGLQGEDVDDAVLYEVWVELWLGCAILAGLAIGPASGRQASSAAPGRAGIALERHGTPALAGTPMECGYDCALAHRLGLPRRCRPGWPLGGRFSQPGRPRDGRHRRPAAASAHPVHGRRRHDRRVHAEWLRLAIAGCARAGGLSRSRPGWLGTRGYILG